MPNPKPPDPGQLVVMGRIGAPFGVRGWVKLQVLTSQPGTLGEFPRWWLGGDQDWREIRVVATREQGRVLLAQFEGVVDRDAAAMLRGMQVAVPREQLPAADENEFYWADLVGLKVVNRQEHEFGEVARIIETGANDVLVVAKGERGGHETLIPFISGVVERVDVAAGMIRVDWGEDY